MRLWFSCYLYCETAHIHCLLEMFGSGNVYFGTKNPFPYCLSFISPFGSLPQNISCQMSCPTFQGITFSNVRFPFFDSELLNMVLWSLSLAFHLLYEVLMKFNTKERPNWKEKLKQSAEKEDKVLTFPILGRIPTHFISRRFKFDDLSGNSIFTHWTFSCFLFESCTIQKVASPFINIASSLGRTLLNHAVAIKFWRLLSFLSFTLF